MQAALACRSLAHSTRLIVALAVGSVPVLFIALTVMANATTSASCRPGSGPHLAGQRITAAELTRYQGTSGLECANLAKANLRSAKLGQAQLDNANLSRSDASGAAGPPAVPPLGPVVSISPTKLHMYVLGGATLIFMLLTLGSIRRFFSFRTSDNFFGGRGFNRPWGGYDASGYNASGYTAAPSPFNATTPAGPYGPMPAAFTGRWQSTGRLAKLGFAILGALIVSIGLWWIGMTVLDAILIPAGKVGYRLCESTCGTRFGRLSPTRLAVGTVVIAVGVTLRIIGRIRY